MNLSTIISMPFFNYSTLTPFTPMMLMSYLKRP